LDVEVPFRNGTEELEVPQLGSDEPAVQEITRAVQVADEESRNQAGHREVVAIA
jgi:hypothetical protein